MLSMLWMWCAAMAAPQTAELSNGVRVVVDNTPLPDDMLDVGWFSATGSAHLAPGATAMALVAHDEGTTTLDTSGRASAWQQALATTPTLHLCAEDAGSWARIDLGDLEAWAWLASDALADSRPDDAETLHTRALDAFPLRPTDGIDQAPSALSWPRVPPDAVASRDAVAAQLAALADPDRLVVVVRGDVTLDAAVSTLRPYFARFRDVPVEGTPIAFERTSDIVVDAHGDDQVVVAADVPATHGSLALARTLDAHVGAGLADVAFEAHVDLVRTAHSWSLRLTATPAPGGAHRVAPAWSAWLQTLAGDGLPPAAPPPVPNVIDLAHDALFGPVADEGSRQTVLTGLIAAPTTLVRQSGPPEDPELDTIRRTIGEMAAELVRIRLRTLETTPVAELDAWIADVERERDAVAPRLRPALDLLITRARERQP